MKTAQAIVITGFMGSGKTTLAQALSLALNCVMVDLDRLITEGTGRSPQQIIDQDGEPAFREVETQFLEAVLARGSARVIALGGGAWTIAANRELITTHNGLSIWLDAPFELCWQRIRASGEERPLARELARARSLYESRRQIYRLAALRIEANEALSDHEMAALIVHALSQSGPVTNQRCA